MRKFSLPALLASFSLIALPAMAQAVGTTSAVDAGIPTSVFWVGGIAAVLGFFLGSIPPNRGEMAASEWDSQGSLLWAFAAAGIFGGGMLFLTTGDMLFGLGAAGFGALIAAMRLLTTRAPRVPTGAPLAEGINRAEGQTPKVKFKAAQKAWKNASFQRDGGRGFATRSPREWHYGVDGIPAADMNMLRDSMANAYSDTFDTLVLLVRYLPEEAEQPAVVVVRGAANLRLVKVDGEGFSIPGQPKILAKSVAAAVGYALR
jgi:hypothetical protein